MTAGHGNSRPVLVCGASSGFGRALADDLVHEGVRVVGTARSRMPPHVCFPYLRADLSVEASAAELVAQVRRSFGVPMGLVYSVSNAEAVSDAWRIDDASMRTVFEATMFGFVRLVRHIMPLMIDAGSGSVVLVGSRAARVPVPTMAAYASAKAAVEHFARCLAEEVRSSGVRVNVLGISADTPLAREHLRRRAEMLGHGGSYPALPAVEDNLPPARFLLSPESAHVTGQTIEARQPNWT
jgi:NAD(P)-dependent dehydrogenase (short-subunit alcohol dehydrogenase family)